MNHQKNTEEFPDVVLQIAGEEGVIDIPFSAVAAYHGHAALAMLALIYQGLRGALAQLEQDGQPVPRKELDVISGHPGPGVRDAFEFVTRAVTRQCYVVDTSLPCARYSRNKDKSYSFWLRRKSTQVQGILKEGVLPDRFFELLGSQDQQTRQEFSALRRQIADAVLQKTPQQLFDYRVEATAEAA